MRHCDQSLVAHAAVGVGCSTSPYDRPPERAAGLIRIKAAAVPSRKTSRIHCIQREMPCVCALPFCLPASPPRASASPHWRNPKATGPLPSAPIRSLPSPTTAAWSAARSRRNISSPTTGIDVLAALPFQHDIAIRDLGRVGSTKHLPPVISLEYHFNAQGKLSRFVGAGIHYTCFFCAPTPTARWPAAI
ncbi:hypothetical protein [Xanthomonas oryzae pv. oryzae MAFF 311018]|nr:hypothetical protein [Xanthomonas oryzae pv. oryzae MAFF 311018]